jgi:hypothetical protein
MGMLFLLQFGSALNQEPDTANILKAALHMELNRTDVMVVNYQPKRLLVRNFPALKTHLKQQGWTWIDQAGAVVIYHRRNERMAANCHMYSRNYMICNLQAISESIKSIPK